MATINFRADLKEIITEDLCSLGHPPKEEEDLPTVLTRYLNFRVRIPPTIKWTVQQSQELANKIIPQEITLGLQEFIDKAESGQDLKPHLSTQSDNPDYQDLMFNDWRIFHFHLGTNPHPNRQGFVERTGDLLFAIADPDTARMYLIDIHPHQGGFTNQDLLRIIDQNWPEIIEPSALQGVDESTYNASDSDIKRYREAGINPILQTPGDRFFEPIGGGITTAGTSIYIEIEADGIITKVRELEEWFIQQPDTIADKFNGKDGKNWDELEFKLRSFEAPVRVEEITTGKMLEISTSD
jgi:hypothetical protein